ncbi:hypothetical protein [Streptomyces sp. RKAG337]|uniref:hypothetical protein n=1 Tax=Streptomyces sp. RKAG337 TaxID=2893404 RepID=UPI0035A9538D
MTVAPDFLPTHVVPPEGLMTWSAPDATQPSGPLDPLLPVQVVDRRGDWALALCSNGWSAWVDGRLLLSVPHGPPAAGQPSARTADPRPLLATVEAEVGRYRRLIEELAAGQLDGEEFRERTRGMRSGVVVDGEAVWLYDARHERWCYCDGVSLRTFAASQRPSVGGGAGGGVAAVDPSEEADVGADETRVAEKTRFADEPPASEELPAAEKIPAAGQNPPADKTRVVPSADHPPTRFGEPR